MGMNLSDEDIMLLEQLTYMNKDVYEAAGIDTSRMSLDKFDSVDLMLEGFTEEKLKKLERAGEIKNPETGATTNIDGYEWAAIIREIKGNKELNDLGIYDTELHVNDSGTKIDKMVFCETDKAGNNNYDDALVCYRGTLDGGEWEDNGWLLVSGDTDRNLESKEYIDKLSEVFDEITVGGHSKGANKAVYDYYLCDSVVRCVAMDLPGMPLEFYEEHADEIKAKVKAHGISVYSTDCDYVNIFLNQALGADYYYCKGHGIRNALEYHCPNSFFNISYVAGYPYVHSYIVHDNNGNIALDYCEQSGSMKNMHDFTLFLSKVAPYEDKVELATFFGHLTNLTLGGADECKFDGVTYTKKEVGKLISNNPETFNKLIAYISVYNDIYSLYSCLSIPYDPNEPISIIAYGLQELLLGEFVGKGVLHIDQETLAYIKAHFSEEYDRIKALEGVGDPIKDLEESNLYGKAAGSGAMTACASSAVLANQEALYVDIRETLGLLNRIDKSVENLVFDRTPLDMFSKVCGTETMVRLQSYWEAVVDTSDRYREFYQNIVAPEMYRMIDSIVKLDTELASTLTVNGPSDTTSSEVSET